jgi:hypothetical protein
MSFRNAKRDDFALSARPSLHASTAPTLASHRGRPAKNIEGTSEVKAPISTRAFARRAQLGSKDHSGPKIASRRTVCGGSRSRSPRTRKSGSSTQKEDKTGGGAATPSNTIIASAPSSSCMFTFARDKRSLGAHMTDDERCVGEVAGLIRANQCRVVLFDRAKRPVAIIKEGWVVRTARHDKDDPRYFMMTRTEFLHFAAFPRPMEQQLQQPTSGKSVKGETWPPLIRRPCAKDVIPLRSVVRAFRVPRGETEAGGFEKYNDGHFVVLELPSRAVIFRADTFKDAEDWARLAQSHANVLRRPSHSLPSAAVPRAPTLSPGRTARPGSSRIVVVGATPPLPPSALRQSPPPPPTPSPPVMTPPNGGNICRSAAAKGTGLLSRSESETPKSAPSTASSKRRALAKASLLQLKPALNEQRESTDEIKQITPIIAEPSLMPSSPTIKRNGDTALVAFYEEATICSVCREEFRFNRSKRPCGKCARPCCTHCLTYDIKRTPVCCVCFSEHVDSVACASRSLSSSAYEQLVYHGTVDGQDGNESDMDFDEEVDVVSQYATSINLGAPVRAVIRSMKQNGVPEKYARRFTAQLGDDAVLAFSEYYESQTGNNATSTDGNEQGVGGASMRDTITVQIEAKFRTDVVLEGSLFDFGPNRQNASDLLPTEIAATKAAFCSKAKMKVFTTESTGANQEKWLREITLVPVQRAQNIAIALSRFKPALFPQLADILFSIGELDDNKINATGLELLIPTTPTPEESRMLQLYSGDSSRLRIAERWMRLLCTSKQEDPVDKFQGFLLGQTLLSRISSVLEKCVSISSACKEVMSSKRFQRVVEAVLQICNVLNENTRLGDADALSLASLLRLTFTRTTSGASNSHEATTMVQYLVKFLFQRGEGEACKLLEDMPNVLSAAKLEKGHIVRQSKELAKDLEMLQKVIAREESLGPLLTNERLIEGNIKAMNATPDGEEETNGTAASSSARGSLLHDIRHASIHREERQQKKKQRSTSSGCRRASIFFRTNEIRAAWIKHLKSICNKVAVELLAVQAATEQMVSDYSTLLRYCCEDDDAFRSSDEGALKIISQFVDAVERAVKENDSTPLDPLDHPSVMLRQR